MFAEISEHHRRSSAFPQGFFDAHADLRQRLALNGEKCQLPDLCAQHLFKTARILARLVELRHQQLIVGADVIGNFGGEGNRFFVMID